MRKKLFLLFILILGVLILSACGQTTADWQDFSSTDGKFSVRMPGDPKEESNTITTDSGEITIHLFGVPIGNTDYIVAYSDYPAELVNSKGSAGILDSARDGAINNTKGKLISDESIELNGFPGKLLVVGSPDGTGIAQAKIFLVGNRLYQVFVATEKDSAYTEENLAFLDSFQFTP
jgi:hypothetical protein